MKIALLLASCWCLSASTALASSNILVVLPLPTYSHFNGYAPIFKELARRGNNVTVVSPYPLKTPMANYTDIQIPNLLQAVFGAFGTTDIRKMSSVIFDIFGFFLMCPYFLDPVLNVPEIQEFISNDRSHFDLIITESFFCLQPFHALSHKYNAPVVTLQPLGLTGVIADYTGNPHPITYTPHHAVKTSDELSWTQKAQSALYYLAEYVGYHLIFKSSLEKYMRDHFKYPGSENIPPLDDLLNDISLVLLDSHISLSSPKPYLPNVIEIGGLSIKEADSLPKDWEIYMNNAKEGVILFSWGSHYKATNMDSQILSKLLSVFSKLKQNVLIKWENETMPGKPDNVRIASWLPQASLLAHPNMKVFISHGGLHGVTESLYHGVPLLGTPLFGDQEENVKLAEKAGYALNIDIDTFTEQELEEALNKLLYEPRFKEAALRRSSVLKDRPISGLESAGYWLEYVIRHKGARHLRPQTPSNTATLLLLLSSPYLALGVALLLLPLIAVALCLRKRAPSPQEKDKKNK